MLRKAHTKETILRAIRSAAHKLGHPPSGPELRSMTGVGREAVLRRFESLSTATRAAGLRPTRRNAPIQVPELLEAWGTLVRQLRRIPRKAEYNRRGKFCTTTFLKRFGGWAAIPGAFLKRFARRRKWADVTRIVKRARSVGQASRPVPLDFRPASPVARPRAKRLSGRPTYGNLLDFRGMRNEPATEIGVVFLFGAVARDLGFQAESIQAGFPDCEALREIAPGKWQRVRIEFEYLSRNYCHAGHPREGCDLIVCWRHNWPECPLEVLELSTAIKLLPARP